VTFLPLRVICIAILLAVAWLLACVGLVGLDEKDVRTKPLTGWRRYYIDENLRVHTQKALNACVHKLSIATHDILHSLYTYYIFYKVAPIILSTAVNMLHKHTAFLLMFGGWLHLLHMYFFCLRWSRSLADWVKFRRINSVQGIFEYFLPRTLLFS